MYLEGLGKTNALDVHTQPARIIQDRGLHKIRFVLMGEGPDNTNLLALVRIRGLVIGISRAGAKEQSAIASQ